MNSKTFIRALAQSDDANRHGERCLPFSPRTCGIHCGSEASITDLQGLVVPQGPQEGAEAAQPVACEVNCEAKPFKRPFSLATRSTGPSVEALIVIFVVDGGRPSADDRAEHAHQRAKSRVYPRDLAPWPRS